MNIVYKASAVSKGGRDGKVTVQNSPLDFEMALPIEMGGAKMSGANPEQLFAAGYAACFGSAMQHVFRAKKWSIQSADIHTTVGIGRNDAGGYSLAVEIVAYVSGIDQQAADEAVQEAHQICPYSNATRGNIEVTVTAKVI